MIGRQAALRDIAQALATAGVEEPRREARLLLAAALSVDAGGLLGVEQVDPAAYAPLLRRRQAREPLAYITGSKEFWGLRLKTSPATLIPRPDSETLVEAALRWGAEKPPARVLDLGTGTGCLLLAVLSAFPSAFGVGVDLSPQAAALAAANAAASGLAGRAVFFAGDWAMALDQKFDLVLANPPYIAVADIPGLMPEVARHEPMAALDGGVDGLAAYHAIIPTLPRLLAPGGVAILELGAGQSQAVALIAAASGFATGFTEDLAGHRRAASLKIRQAEAAIGSGAELG